MDTEASSASDADKEIVPGAPEADAAETTPATEGAAETPDANEPGKPSVPDEEDAKGPESMFDAVKTALETPSEGDAASSAAESGKEPDAEGKTAGTDDPTQKSGEGEGEKAKGDEDADKPPPFHDHPRWKQLVQERDDLKAAAEESNEAVQATDRLANYLTEQRLSVDEFNNLLQIGGLMKNDPVKALEALTPYYTKLLEVTGNTLPADLRTAVDQGLLTEDYATETAKARANANVTQFASDNRQQLHAAQAQTQQVDNLGDAASDWERKWQASDPDYSKKAIRVQERIELAVHRKELTGASTAAEVVAACERYKGEVEAELRALMPKPKAVNTNPNAGTGGSGSAAANAPKSMIEAMEAAISG
jgi:hypothetical protein